METTTGTASTVTTTAPPTSTETVTTTTTPTTATAVYPPGVTATGVPEPYALAAAHVDRLRDSYTVTEQYRIRYDDGTLYRNESATVRVAADPSRYLATTTVAGTGPNFLGGANGTLEVYSNGTTVVRRVTGGRNTTYGVYTDAAGDPVDPAAVAHGTPRNDERIATLLSYARDVTVERRADAVRIEATGLATDTLAVSGVTLTNVSGASLVATVGPDGLVREYRLSFQGTLDGRAVTVNERVRYTAVGTTTVAEPPWYGEALAATDEG